MKMTVYRQALFAFPAAHRADTTVQVCGYLLPRIETVFRSGLHAPSF
jgi:hypothetical protein